MRTTLLVAAALSLSGLCACGGTGSCVGTGGIIDSCKPNWTAEECQDWDDLMVNGANWTLSGSSCDALGYTKVCSGGTHLLPTDSC